MISLANSKFSSRYEVLLFSQLQWSKFSYCRTQCPHVGYSVLEHAARARDQVYFSLVYIPGHRGGCKVVGLLPHLWCVI